MRGSVIVIDVKNTAVRGALLLPALGYHLSPIGDEQTAHCPFSTRTVPYCSSRLRTVPYGSVLIAEDPPEMLKLSSILVLITVGSLTFAHGLGNTFGAIDTPGFGPQAFRRAIASVRDPKSQIEEYSPLRRGLLRTEGQTSLRIILSLMVDVNFSPRWDESQQQCAFS